MSEPLTVTPRDPNAAVATHAASPATVIANVWGDLEDDYVTVVRALEGADRAADGERGEYR